MGKVIEEANCFSIKEVVDNILKVLRNVRFEVTRVSVKIGKWRTSLQGLAQKFG